MAIWITSEEFLSEGICFSLETTKKQLCLLQDFSEPLPCGCPCESPWERTVIHIRSQTFVTEVSQGIPYNTLHGAVWGTLVWLTPMTAAPCGRLSEETKAKASPRAGFGLFRWGAMLGSEGPDAPAAVHQRSLGKVVSWEARSIYFTKLNCSDINLVTVC